MPSSGQLPPNLPTSQRYYSKPGRERSLLFQYTYRSAQPSQTKNRSQPQLRSGESPTRRKPTKTRSSKSSSQQTSAGTTRYGEADERITCAPWHEEYGSDHKAIEIVFAVEAELTEPPRRLLFKETKWRHVCDQIKMELEHSPLPSVQDVNAYQEKLTNMVSRAVHAHTPTAKQSPYAKRCWHQDLTRVRADYTWWRNQARQYRRCGQRHIDLDKSAAKAKKTFFDGVRKQRKDQWEEFLDSADNAWSAARYLKPASASAFSKIPELTTNQGKASTAPKIVQELLKSFFPVQPTPAATETRQLAQAGAIGWDPITKDEVRKAIYAANPYKAPGVDGLPAIVSKKTWSVIQDRVTTLFQYIIDHALMPAAC